MLRRLLSPIPPPESDNLIPLNVRIVTNAAQSDVSAARVIDTIYQNLTDKVILALVSIRSTIPTLKFQGYYCKCDSVTPPVDIVAQLDFANEAPAQITITQTATFIIPPNYYYYVTAISPFGSIAIMKWIEYQLR